MDYAPALFPSSVARKKIFQIVMTILMMPRASPLQMWSRFAAGPTPASRVARRTLRRSTLVMMPEGPEVRTLVDQLQPAVGMRLVNFQFLSGRYVRQGRPKGFEDFAKTMTPLTRTEDVPAEGSAGGTTGSTDVIKALSCKGKFIYLVLDPDPGIPVGDFQRSIW